MLKIWGRTNSVNVQKVLWCAAELGLEYERIDAGMAFGQNDEDWFLAMNPNGRIPVIDDDGFSLWESNTIVRYLAARYGDGDLYPDSAQIRADAERWMDWQLSVLNGPLTVIFWGLVRTPPEQRDAEAIQRGETDTNAALNLLDQHLANRSYVAGSQFTVGDIPVGAMVYRWFLLPEIERPEFSHLQMWHGRLCERDAFRAHVILPLS